MEKLKSIFKGNTIRQYSMIIVLVAMIIFFNITTKGLLFTPLNLTNIVLQNSYVVILIIGMLPVILTGNIDLSAGSVAAVVGAVAAILQVNKGVGFVPTLLISLLIGCVIGAWQGFWIAYRGIPAFIATLSSQLVFRGLTILVLDGRSIGPFSDAFRAMSSSFIPDILGGSGLHLTTIALGVIAVACYVLSTLSNRREKLKNGIDAGSFTGTLVKMIVLSLVILVVSYYFASYQGFPTVMIIMIVLTLLYSFITGRTIIGRHLYAIGGNKRAAALSGVKVERTLFITYVNMGLMAALAGVVYAARLNAGTPKAGNGFELDAIAACFVGGASVSGGVGTVAGALIGCFVIGIMNNGMSIMGVSVDIQQAIKGLVILFAVAFDMYSKSKQN